MDASFYYKRGKQGMKSGLKDREMDALTKGSSVGIEPRRNTHFYPESIIRIEGCSSYSKIICTEGPPFLISRVLGWFEGMLSEKDFLRIHKSHVVNLGFVLQRETGGRLRLRNGEVIPVSRTYKLKLSDKLNHR